MLSCLIVLFLLQAQAIESVSSDILLKIFMVSSSALRGPVGSQTPSPGSLRHVFDACHEALKTKANARLSRLVFSGAAKEKVQNSRVLLLNKNYLESICCLSLVLASLCVSFLMAVLLSAV